MSTGLITIDNAAFSAALARFVSTSKKSSVELMRQQARLLFVEVANVTPPAGGKSGATLKGKAAEKAGQLAITRDYHQLYGMPGRAYGDIQSKSQRAADAFWSHFKHDRLHEAGQIVKSVLGKSFVPFDGGKAARGFLGKKRRQEALFYISNPTALHEHVSTLQEHVWFLASGWGKALRQLGARLPYGIDKHAASPGFLRVTITEAAIEIAMVNEVRYARQIKKFSEQLAFAMKVREGALTRRYEAWLAALAKRGLKSS